MSKCVKWDSNPSPSITSRLMFPLSHKYPCAEKWKIKAATRPYPKPIDFLNLVCSWSRTFLVWSLHSCVHKAVYIMKIVLCCYGNCSVISHYDLYSLALSSCTAVPHSQGYIQRWCNDYNHYTGRLYYFCTLGLDSMCAIGVIIVLWHRKGSRKSYDSNLFLTSLFSSQYIDSMAADAVWRKLWPCTSANYMQLYYSTDHALEIDPYLRSEGQPKIHICWHCSSVMHMHTCEDYWELLVILKYSNSSLQSVDSIIATGNRHQCSIAQLPLLCKSIRVYVYT